MSKRDEFSPKVKRTLAARSGNHCSNPACRALTAGPEEQDNAGSINMGEAAHITAASPGGCRYDCTLSSTERSGIENGIWLCTLCATLIDKKEEDFQVELLREWKRHALNFLQKKKQNA